MHATALGKVPAAHTPWLRHRRSRADAGALHQPHRRTTATLARAPDGRRGQRGWATASSRRVRERRGRCGGARSGSTAASVVGALASSGPTDRSFFDAERATAPASWPTELLSPPPERHRPAAELRTWPNGSSPRSTRARRSTPLPAVRPRRPHGRRGPARAPPPLPAARLGRARRRGDLAQRHAGGPRALRAGRHRRPQIATLGIANQRETTVVWDPTPAVRWRTRSPGRTSAPPTSSRSSSSTPRRSSSARSAGSSQPYFAGPRLRWLLDHVPGLRASAPRRATRSSGPWRPG